MTQRFEWDETKAATNLRKHGMSFEEAASVFSEALAYTFVNPEGSWGQVFQCRIFTVHTSHIWRCHAATNSTFARLPVS